jgi:hypothetical protein
MSVNAVLLAAAALVVGYLLGRVDALLATLRGQSYNTPPGFFAKKSAPQLNPAASGIKIDERKVVTEIRTDTLAKTQDIQLGTQIVAQDDINAAVNKLAQLKRS